MKCPRTQFMDAIRSMDLQTPFHQMILIRFLSTRTNGRLPHSLLSVLHRA